MEKLTKHANGQWTLEKASPMNDMEHPACKSEKEPHKDDPKHEEKEKQKAKDIKSKAEEILDMHKERRAEHGEVIEKDAKNPELAPKEVKIKQLQSQIDAGKYKVDSKKVADKMVSKLKLNKGGQWTLDGGDV